MTPRPSPEAIAGFGECLAEGLRKLYGVDGSTVEEAARAALTPTGPSYDELVQRITARRAAAAAAVVRAS